VEGGEPAAVLNWDTLVEPALVPNNRVVGIYRISVHTPRDLETRRRPAGTGSFVAHTYRQR
jgi:hypothetical protein